jgi:hypothetical protein
MEAVVVIVVIYYHYLDSRRHNNQHLWFIIIIGGGSSSSSSSSNSYSSSRIYCILASCYIRFTLNICSFVHQCNTFTFYLLLLVDMFRPHRPSSSVIVYSPEAGALLCHSTQATWRPQRHNYSNKQ